VRAESRTEERRLWACIPPPPLTPPPTPISPPSLTTFAHKNHPLAMRTLNKKNPGANGVPNGGAAAVGAVGVYSSPAADAAAHRRGGGEARSPIP
jgi:hypothetical protein